METIQFPFFATCPKGMASVLITELAGLGATPTKESVAGVHFGGTLETAYRACLWSRTANHILAPIVRVAVTNADELYRAVRAVDWGSHMSVDSSFLVDFTGHGAGIDHSQFGAQKVKDGIVDWFRDACGDRPSVDKSDPALRIHVHLEKGMATISIGLSGRSLHERGYRTRFVAAPMKENLAAAILLRLGWPEIAARGGALIDPMCGSATLLIEGAWMAGDVAPGLLRSRFGFEGWVQHDKSVWESLVLDAHARSSRGLAALPSIVGFDHDEQALNAARANIQAAGLRGRVQVQRVELDEVADANETLPPHGLVVMNPPYGERLGKDAEVADLYRRIGHVLKTRYQGWRAGMFTAAPEFGKRMGLRANKIYSFFNGALPCKLLCFEVLEAAFVNAGPARDAAPTRTATQLSAGAGMFANRLRKNLNNLGRWADREGIACYRLYDADMPEYAFAIDLYHGETRKVHVQEYAPPATIAVEAANLRRLDALLVIPEVLGIPADSVYLKTRQRQKEGGQYERLEQSREFFEVREGRARLRVNLRDYLDTGLFLDHRITRALVAELSRGKRMLNLFCYTGAATVQAALAGALESTSVDMSYTYLDWANANLELNDLDTVRHRIVQNDCLHWLFEANERGNRYDTIFLDPPTFSRSKRMSGTFDVQRDYVELITQAAQLLSEGGVLIFSTNLRTFTIDETQLNRWTITDITAQTIPRDFARNPRIHRCFRVEHKRHS